VIERRKGEMNMAVQSSIVAGVFTNGAQARSALEALRQAEFRVDQVGLARKGQEPTELYNSLLNLGVSGDRASYYAQELQAGNTIVSVRADAPDQEQQALDILRSNGAYDFDQKTATTQSTADTDVAETTDVQDDYHQPRALRLREERLDVQKQAVQSGEVHVRKDVVEEQKNIDVPVSHEEVYIERRPVADGQVDSTPIGQDEVIRVPVSEEQVNVTKTPVVTGEVAVGKRKVQETQQVSDTVRREEARVDRDGDVPVQDNDANQISQ
jgi:uncharacterized protein (TIGR02271 family)